MRRSRNGGAKNHGAGRSLGDPTCAPRGASISPAALATPILAVHVVALLIGGGLAVAHDRGTLRAAGGLRPESADDSRRAYALAELGAVHRIVGTALAVSIVTGVALFFIHSERYVVSAVFWVKMALVVGLTANALVMQLAERDIREAPGSRSSGNADGVSRAWRRLEGTAKVSSTLWILVAVAGTILGQAR